MNSLKTFGAVWFALCVIASTGAAATPEGKHSHGGHSSPERAAQAELGATAAFDAKGTLWAAHKIHGYVAVSRSDDLGQTWSRAVHVNPTLEATDPGADARPKVAIGPAGQIYVTWTKALSKPHTGEIRFARSLDGGKTFSAPLTVHRDRQEITHRFDAIAVDGDGRIFIAWIDKRDLVLATQANEAYRGAAVYYAVSDDGGASFRGDFKLADHACECCRIGLARTGDDAVHAMWRHVFAPNVRDHAVARLHPEGKLGEVRRATFDDWRFDACPHHGPSLAAQKGGPMHAVWFTLGTNGAGVFYGRLRDHGIDGKRRVGGEGAAHADLAVSGDRVAVAWKEFDGERTQLRAMVSDNGGGTWSEHPVAATSGASDQPRVLVREGRFYIFWNTRHEALTLNSLP